MSSIIGWFWTALDLQKGCVAVFCVAPFFVYFFSFNSHVLRMILITNDDGVFAKGIKTLASVVSDIDEVVVVAPDKTRSACSSSITVSEPLRSSKLLQGKNVTVYSLSGTPTDCVKYAIDVILKGERPSLLLSGINHGTNTSINSVYSGTVSAVIEGCLKGVSSVAFSILSTKMDADFSECVPYIKKITSFVANNPLPRGTCLNVNFPVGEIKGLKAVRQADASWQEEIDYRPRSGQCGGEYWIGGRFVDNEPDAEDTDLWAVRNGYASIVPIKVDFTDYKYLSNLKIDSI